MKPGELKNIEGYEFEEKTETNVQEENDGEQWNKTTTVLGTYLGLVNPAKNEEYIKHILKDCLDVFKPMTHQDMSNPVIPHEC
jgi:hypothetical protein